MIEFDLTAQEHGELVDIAAAVAARYGEKAGAVWRDAIRRACADRDEYTPQTEWAADAALEAWRALAVECGTYGRRAAETLAAIEATAAARGVALPAEWPQPYTIAPVGADICAARPGE
ncbi:MAG: hypothetical protein J6P03_08565 [Opitutales bacterium]|nr:hypothetical protein [Opitutales bacterium]